MSYEPITVGTSSYKGVLAIRQFQENREERKYPNEFGISWMSYIPLLPYVGAYYERLDESYILHQSSRGNKVERTEHFTVKIPQSMALDFGESALFEEVRYIGDAEPGADVDFVLSGKLHSTRFNKYISSYLFGMPGVLLWFLPIPMGKTSAEIIADLELRDRNGMLVWNYPLKGESSRMYTMYNSGGAAISSQFSLVVRRYGSNDEGVDSNSFWAYHASALRAAMAGAKRSLIDSEVLE